MSGDGLAIEGGEMRRAEGGVIGEDATLLEKTRTRKTRRVTDSKFRVFLSLKPWQNIQT